MLPLGWGESVHPGWLVLLLNLNTCLSLMLLFIYDCYSSLGVMLIKFWFYCLKHPKVRDNAEISSNIDRLKTVSLKYALRLIECFFNIHH